MARMVKCVKLQKELPGLEFKPFANELGQKIYDNVSQEAWKLWLEHFKMIMKEYRLGVRVAARVRELNPSARVAFFGLYAQLNREHLLARHGEFVIGGEAFGPLAALAVALSSGSPLPPGVSTREVASGPWLEKRT